jgi:hypothetical protein
VVLHRLTVPPNDQRTESAHCPAGKKVLGGGFRTDPGLDVVDSYPAGDDRWEVLARNDTDSGKGLHIHAVCATAL